VKNLKEKGPADGHSDKRLYEWWGGKEQKTGPGIVTLKCISVLQTKIGLGGAGKKPPHGGGILYTEEN